MNVEIIGRFAREAAALGEADVCVLLPRSFYLRFPGERYVCVGDVALGRGPLNALVSELRMPRLGERTALSIAGAALWRPAAMSASGPPAIEGLRQAAARRVPEEGLGCLILGKHNAVAMHAQPGLEALDRWIVGNTLEQEAEALLGLGPGITPSGDDYLGGVLVALRLSGRTTQAQSLWRWLEPRIAGRTSTLSAAHLAAAAEGEGHEALHECLRTLVGGGRPWEIVLAGLDAMGDCSGWDALAGALAVFHAA
ncbi:MAG TPA: DUF2877 domain-containing protein [Burkholderiales bacterium]